MANTAFNKTVFEGSATSQAFEWDICMENKWPRYQHNLRQLWNDGSSGQGVGRAQQFITGQDWNNMFVDLQHTNPIRLHQSDYVAILMRGEDTRHSARQHRVLEARQNSASRLGVHMYGFRVILTDIIAAEDIDRALTLLIERSQGQLEQFIENRELFLRVVGEIIDGLELRPPTLRDPGLLGPGEPSESNRWVRTFWGQEHIGPPDRDQWRDHDM